MSDASTREVTVIYDVISKRVLITRGDTSHWLGPFSSREEARKAADEYCQTYGLIVVART